MTLEQTSLRAGRVDSVTPVAVIVADSFLARRIVTALAAAEAEVTVTEPAEARVVVLGDEGAKAQLRALIDALKSERPRLGVVVVTQTASAGRCRRSLDAGADGVVLAPAVESGLVKAVAAVAAGHLVQPRSLAPARRQTTLSDREKQVLGLVVLGLTNREIAGRLYVAECTVKSHLRSIFAKLGVGSRKEAVAAVLDPQRGLGLGVLALTRPAWDTPTPSSAEA